MITWGRIQPRAPIGRSARTGAPWTSAAAALVLVTAACGGSGGSSAPERSGSSLIVSPRTPFEAGGPRGGPFAPASQSYAITNWSAGTTVDWSVRSSASWLSVSPSSGSLAPGQTLTISVDVDDSVAWNLADGRYSEAFEIEDENAGTVAVRLPAELWVGVALGGDTWLRVDGEKFFPIYAWNQPPQESWVDYHSGLGINTLVEHPAFSSSGVDLLDMLAAKGMHGILSLDPSVSDHPALLAWTTTAEPFATGLSPTVVDQEYRDVRAVDPHHPVLTSFSSAFYWDANFGTSANEPVFQQYTAIPDVVGFGHYPVAEWSQPTWLYMAGAMVTFLNDVYVDGSRPIWELIEASDFRRAPGSQGPTAAQVRFQVWDAILRGATGIGYYVLANDPVPSANVDAAVAQEIARTNAQITALTDVLLSTPPQVSVHASAAGGLDFDYALRRSGSTLWLIAANADMGYGATSITFGFDQPLGTVKVYGESRSIVPTGSSFTDDFAPLEVHVYEIGGVLAPGVWISKIDLISRPDSGAEWDSVLAAARELIPGNADVSDKNSNHDVETMAAALAGVRLDDADLKDAALSALLAAIGTETGEDWLAASRNLTAYVIAADLLRQDGIVDARIDAWFEGFLYGAIQLPTNTGRGSARGISPFHSGSNAAAQEGLVYVALAAYLNDRAALDYGWERFRVYVGDRPVTNSRVESPTIGHIDIGKGIDEGWSHDPNDPKPINPLGAVGVTWRGVTVNIDGIIINDQRRGGTFDWPPGYTQYPWLGLEGAVPAGLILQRMGYPAFSAGDNALLRAVEAMWRLGLLVGENPTCTEDCWWDYDRSEDVKHLVNQQYGRTYPHASPVGKGRTVGFTDWTHP